MKKIIAREFLVLLGTVFLFCIVFFSWAKLTDYNNKRHSELEKNIPNHYTYKNLPLRLRIFYTMNDSIKSNSWKTMEPTVSNYISKLQTDSLFVNSTYEKLVYEYPKATITFELFKERIRNDVKSKKHLQYLISTETEIEDIEESWFYGQYNLSKKALKFSYVFLIIFFILRYIYYAVIWSVKQLKE
ncbi:hypothetical protein [Winogradskyella sp.]|uniref:hypothetical protein n=1 Tax=Winogradskyella sp. TaxID=1883156 RepID=UPI003AB230DC